MNNLVLKEKQEFMGIQIPVIEGGFGEGQKVILAKTVAEIHEVSTPDINKLINRNIERFTINDLLDIKNCQSLSDQQFLSMGFTKMQISKAENIFVLSQRGYTKLVAMMDNSNDKKWDVMNNLIDDYFNMRNQLSSGQAPKEISAIDLFEAQVQAFKEVRGEVIELKNEIVDTRNDFEEFKEDLPLIGAEPEELQATVRSVGTRALGGYECPAYNDTKLRSRVYQSVWKYVKEQFNVRKYRAIKRKHLSKAKEIAESYTAPFYLQEEINMINNQGKLNI
ncbi:ORF6C domain-containing protein [Clostridium perfringens]|uniref:ORF6C domain-containing protein n=1 Tax=Clostridium perfringens TaxID=1502 RepID=UPI0024BC5FF9|nr:ORF6C domain-containing protein [Clostridium perfringens]